MFGLMIGFMLIIGLGIVFLGFSRSGDVGTEATFGNWWPGLWGMNPFMLVFPCLGFGMMILMMFFFFSGKGRRGGLMGRGGPMGWMWGSGPENSGRQSTPSQTDLLCSQCDAPVQTGWNVCPQCGASLK
jgi:hypothetical protein